jgi:D-beta-D-heptose 7-phosphate kinase/D-beta-D-heptose 1-phosphate adenosyltransferase
MPEINSYVRRAPSVKVIVVGDCMLDAYVSGTASRISPEAPVPVVEVSRRRYLAGGAANVAANLRSLGAVVSIAGITGTDNSGVRLREELAESGIDTAALVEDASRITTTKTRVTAAGQQIVRFDDEDRSPLPEPLFKALCGKILLSLEHAHVCVISDYAKGVVDERLCRWLMAEANKRDLPVVVDPKWNDLSRYRGATLITPNLKEACAAAGGAIHSVQDLAWAAEQLLLAISPSSLLVTQGEDGMSLFRAGQPARHLPALVNEIADVTGAGDTVVAALAIALGMRLSLFEAAEIANIAAGVAVSHHGTWAVKADEMLAYAETVVNQTAVLQ